MGQWSCKCGRAMNDHAYPDENHYIAYSDEVWESIDTDDAGNINYMEIILCPTYSAYQCPDCGNLMICDGNSNYFKIYVPDEDRAGR